MNQLDIDTLRILLRYDAESGLLYWRQRDREFFKTEINWRQWNSRLAGKQAFMAVGNHGYHKGTILNKWFRAHRVVWALHYGAWPHGFIDHLNGDRKDNRIANLRVVDFVQNGRNQKLRKSNTSGVMGVCWHKLTQKWAASIKIAGKASTHLGIYSDIEDAIAARKEAERVHGYYPNHGRTNA
jgi:hypothetical protein